MEDEGVEEVEGAVDGDPSSPIDDVDDDDDGDVHTVNWATSL